MLPGLCQYIDENLTWWKIDGYNWPDNGDDKHYDLAAVLGGRRISDGDYVGGLMGDVSHAEYRSSPSRENTTTTVAAKKKLWIDSMANKSVTITLNSSPDV